MSYFVVYGLKILFNCLAASALANLHLQLSKLLLQFHDHSIYLSGESIEIVLAEHAGVLGIEQYLESRGDLFPKHSLDVKWPMHMTPNAVFVKA